MFDLKKKRKEGGSLLTNNNVNIYEKVSLPFGWTFSADKLISHLLYLKKYIAFSFLFYFNKIHGSILLK